MTRRRWGFRSVDMETPLEYGIYALAAWRIASLLVNEKGPWNVFLRLRLWTGIEHDTQGRHTIIPDGFLAGILSCVWCCSVWVGTGMVILAGVWPGGALWFAKAMALSAAVVILEVWIRNR